MTITMFTRKTISSMPRKRTYFFKYMTMFFLGASAVILGTQAFDINTTLQNAVQYISKIVITSDGGNTVGSITGIVLDGSGNAFFSGKVGIGDETPSYKLDVNGSGRFVNNLLVDGNVGLGTATSSERLNVNGTVKIDSYLELRAFSQYGIMEGTYGLQFNTSGTNTRMTITQDGTVGIGRSGSVCGVANVCGLTTNRDIYSNGGDMSIVGGDVGIGYDVGASTGGGNLYVDGNVGIGTSNPTNKLEVVSGGKISLFPLFVATFGGFPGITRAENAAININFDPATGSGIYIGNLNISNRSLGYIASQTDDFRIRAGDNLTPTLAITTGGNVGIGTSSPEGKFDVLGVDGQRFIMGGVGGAARFTVMGSGNSGFVIQNSIGGDSSIANIDGDIMISAGVSEHITINTSGEIEFPIVWGVEIAGSPCDKEGTIKYYRVGNVGSLYVCDYNSGTPGWHKLSY